MTGDYNEVVTHFHPIYAALHCGDTTGLQGGKEKEVNCPACLSNLADSKRLTVTFPKLKFAKENELYTQMVHMSSEMEEVWNAYHEPGYQRIAEEIVDLMQSCSTALYIIERLHAVDIDSIVKAVFKKNKARNYE
jgi:hypothetical protein